jgi:plasmid stabilization system protein ParE
LAAELGYREEDSAAEAAQAVKLIVSRAAQADLERLHAFLVKQNPAAALQAATSLDNAMRSLDAFPKRGLPSGVSGVRELIVPFGRSAYVVRYAVLADTGEIVVLRIWHGRERRE